MSVKYVFVTGGVVSGLGKGITSASLGRLLKERGYRVTMQKFDPYINVDPGKMSPYQHGEVFVTDDGAETDLDVGHYERFIDENLSIDSDITSGSVYWSVLNKERKGEYGGITVQVIPHITNEIKDSVYRLGRENDTDIVITEIGGTVGDIESLPFIESIRQIFTEVGRENAMFIHVTLVPTVPGSTELKSKPTQHSVKELLSLGIQPNVIVCRSDYPIPYDLQEKIALFCSTRPEDIVQNITVSSLYEAPLMLEEEGLAKSVCYHLKLDNVDTPPMTEWRSMIKAIKSADKQVEVAVVGKYTELPDAYISLMEALAHGGIPHRAKVNVELINSEDIEKTNVSELLGKFDAIVVPSGFGPRGLEGKVLAAEYARTNNLPYLGICLGQQVAAIGFARNVLNISSANSKEFEEDCDEPVVHLLPSNPKVGVESGKMRLGSFPIEIKKGTLLHSIYGSDSINERYRHKYTINPDYTERLEAAGMKISATCPGGDLIEAIEYPAHPWYLAVQWNPEFKSRPNRPHPIFDSFIKTALELK